MTFVRYKKRARNKRVNLALFKRNLPIEVNRPHGSIIITAKAEAGEGVCQNFYYLFVFKLETVIGDDEGS